MTADVQVQRCCVAEADDDDDDDDDDTEPAWPM